jgi:hypothetical protein
MEGTITKAGTGRSQQRLVEGVAREGVLITIGSWRELWRRGWSYSWRSLLDSERLPHL